MRSKTKKNNLMVPEIINLNQPIKAIGLSVRTSMKSIFKDVTKVLKQYMSNKDKYGISNQKKPWEYVSLSKDFSDDKTWNYFTGHVVTDINNVPEVFTSFEIPISTYAVFQVRPKNKLLLGFAIGKTKKYIYSDWMIKSKYEFTGFEFEYNNEKMFRENPHYIDLYVGIKEKECK